MPMPRWLARVNKRVFNPWEIRKGKRPVLIHAGRSSGATYETPLDAHPIAGGYLFIPMYGPRTDWVKNVMAAGAARLGAPLGGRRCARDGRGRELAPPVEEQGDGARVAGVERAPQPLSGAPRGERRCTPSGEGAGPGLVAALEGEDGRVEGAERVPRREEEVGRRRGGVEPALVEGREQHRLGGERGEGLARRGPGRPGRTGRAASTGTG